MIGKALVPQLVAIMHTVTAPSRSSGYDKTFGHFGAYPLIVNLYDFDALTWALRGYDAIFHLATKIPPTMQMGKQ